MLKLGWQWSAAPEAIAGRIAGPEAKLFAARAWHELYAPYVPMGQTGRLRGDVSFSGDGVVTHEAPYAGRQYERARWDEGAKAAGLGTALARAIEGHLRDR